MKYGAMIQKQCPPFSKYKSIKKFDCNDYPITHFLRTENVELICGLDIDVCNKYKNNDNTLIFLDPPYMNTNNNEYLDPTLHIYEYLYNNNINDWKAKVWLILEHTWLISLIFTRNNTSKKYNKTYQGTQKKTTHVIISNIISFM